MCVYFLFLLCASVKLIDGAQYMETKADFIKTCQRKSPNFVPCTTESTQLLYKQLAIGIKGLEDLQFDPMKVKKIQILDDGGPVSINTTITKGVVTGFSNIVVVENVINQTDYSWTTKLHLPKLRIAGQYRMQGRVLVLPLVGSGKCWFEPSGLDFTVYTTTRLYEKFGHIFYNIIGVKVEFKISGFKLYLHNLFDGVKVLEESTNKYLNENWKPVSESLKPILAKSIEDQFYETLNKIFDFIPADYFISDIEHPSAVYGGASSMH